MFRKESKLGLLRRKLRGVKRLVGREEIRKMLGLGLLLLPRDLHGRIEIPAQQMIFGLEGFKR